MSEIIYSIDQEIIKNQTFLIIHIEILNEAKKRFIYRDTLKTLAKPIEKDAIAFLIREQLRYLGINPISSQADTAAFNKIHIMPQRCNELLKLLAATGKLFWKGKKIFVDPFTRFKFYYDVKDHENEEWIVEGKLAFQDKAEDLMECDWIFPGDPIWFIKKGTLQTFSEDIDWKWVQLVYPSHKILTQNEKKSFLKKFEDNDAVDAPKVIWRVSSKQAHSTQQECFPFLILQDRSGAFADLWLDYGKAGKVAFHDMKSFDGRDLPEEMAWEKDLLETDFIKKIVDSSHYYCPMDKVSKSLTFLLEVGWKIFDHHNRQVVRHTQAALSLVNEKNHFLVKGKISYEEHETDLKDVIGAFNRRERFVLLNPQTVGLLDTDRIAREWGDLAEQELTVSGIKVKKSHLGLLESFLEDKDVERDIGIEEIANRIKEGGSVVFSPPGTDFLGTLHSYQQAGVDWLSFLHEQGLHGLLADEMGLGKTVQIIAFLSRLKSCNPHLIVVPTSLVFNWRKEFEKFLPEFPIYLHTGKDREKTLEILQEKKLIITSYALLRIDAELFYQLCFTSVILDEAQYVKNSESQISGIITRLKSDLRVAITGTPIENRPEDLWSLFSFLIPELLGNKKEFSAKMTAAAADPRYLGQVKKKVRPFILRRRKDQVADQLPPKVEQIIWVEMKEAQRKMYEEWLCKNRLGLLKKVEEEGISSHRMEIFEAILRLRQISCHPLLVDRSFEQGVFEGSGKLEQILHDLESVVQEGGKVLLYSQFTQMLKIIEKEVQNSGLKYVYLDGSTQNREEVVRQFQEDPETQVFLISLKAGGVGLNLTAADYVFLFDPWWNEAVERQAIDRAHRMGRKGSVIARRYVTVNSIEEKIMRLKEHKMSLSEHLLDLEQETVLSTTDLLELLR